MSERALIAASGAADRLLIAGLEDLRPVLAELRGSVLLVGGLMARIWLHLRPVEDLAPRATADIDLGIDRHRLRLTASSERVRPLLEARDYEPLPGEDGFRFRKRYGEHEILLVDLFIAKGASRDEPPILEKGVSTLAAPGLAYALARGPAFADVRFADAGRTTEIELPLPSLDAAFVLKGSLAASGVRTRPDRVQRDRVDAIMLAAACLQDAEARNALREATGKEPRDALRWLERAADDGSPVAATLEEHLRTQYAVQGGDEWARGIAAALVDASR